MKILFERLNKVDAPGGRLQLSVELSVQSWLSRKARGRNNAKHEVAGEKDNIVLMDYPAWIFPRTARPPRMHMVQQHTFDQRSPIKAQAVFLALIRHFLNVVFYHYVIIIRFNPKVNKQILLNAIHPFHILTSWENLFLDILSDDFRPFKFLILWNTLISITINKKYFLITLGQLNIGLNWGCCSEITCWRCWHTTHVFGKPSLCSDRLCCNNYHNYTSILISGVRKWIIHYSLILTAKIYF